ncbi:MAG: sulfatase [Firmicutes bacterium]|nr:sulfatase [Bacillota bacterium]MCL5039301.1 sulfatase [Bacillota bacterium]
MNTIVVLMDSLRRDFLSCYGNDWVLTPNVAHFAARSTVFEQAYVGSYPCMPARRDLWTGRLEFPFRGWGPLEPGETEIAALVKGAGRTSMLITDHYHLWERGSGNYHFSFGGVEFIRGQENDAWLTDPTPVYYPAAPEKLARHARPGSWERYCRNSAHLDNEEDYCGAQVFQQAVKWLEANRTHKDFFLMIDSFDPHEPFNPPKPYIDLYAQDYQGERVIWPTYGWCNLSPEELAYVKALYAGKVTMADHWFGRLLDKVDELGLTEETAIILTSDHGHLFGEHGLIGKPWSAIADSNLYEELARIPLIIYYPGAAPRRLNGLVQLLDLFPTLCQIMGLSVPGNIHGQSLLPAIQQGVVPDRSVALFGRYGEALNVTDGEWSLFLWPSGESNEPLYWYSTQPPVYGKLQVTGPLEASSWGWRYPVSVARGQSSSALYHIATDPGQRVNLYDRKPQELTRLIKAAKEHLKSIGAPPEIAERLGL